MLRIVEYSLLAVSLLVVIGLIVSGSRGASEASRPEALPPVENEDGAPAHGKPV